MREGANRLKGQIAKVMETDEKTMTGTCGEIVKTVLAESWKIRNF